MLSALLYIREIFCRCLCCFNGMPVHICRIVALRRYRVLYAVVGFCKFACKARINSRLCICVIVFIGTVFVCSAFIGISAGCLL